MSYFSGLEEAVPGQLEAFHHFSNEDETFRYYAPLFQNPVYYQTHPPNGDVAEQLVPGFQAISFGSPNFFSRVLKHEQNPHYDLLEPFRQRNTSCNFNQEPIVIQPYPCTPFTQRQPSPGETDSSISSHFDVYEPYPTSSVDSDLDSYDSPALTILEEFGYASQHNNPMISYGHSHCALSEIQTFPDENQERNIRFPQEQDLLPQEISLKDECYCPITPSQSSYEDHPAVDEHNNIPVANIYLPSNFASDDDEKDSDYTPSRSKNRRPCRRPTKQPIQNAARSKVTKRISPKSQNLKENKHIPNAMSPAEDSIGNISKSSPFSCPLTPYGCKSTFKSKNEWKRHIVSRHLYLGFWRCDCCPDVKTRPNDFNRKDLFIQHLRRMHHPQKEAIGSNDATKTPIKAKKANKKIKIGVKDSNNSTDPTSEDFENSLANIQDRCWIGIREYPTRALCAFCEQIFEGKGSFEAWLEHAGKHLSSSAKQSINSRQDTTEIWDNQIWLRDTIFREWLQEEGFLRIGEDGQWTLVDDETAHFINMQKLDMQENM